MKRKSRKSIRDDAGDQVGIYQCRNCRNVIGNDKFRSEETCDDKNYIYLQEVDNCLIQTSVHASRKAIDLDCRYRYLECCMCHVIVGHQYCKAAKKFPQLKGLNAIILSAIAISYTKIPLQSEIGSKVFEGLQRKMKSLEDQLDSLRSQPSETDLFYKVESLESQVKKLNEDVNCHGSRIEDLAVVSVDALQDRVGIKEAVANLLVVISNELDENIDV